MGRVLQKEQLLLDQRGIMRVSHIYNKLAITVHLHATHVNRVIGVDNLIYPLIYLIKRAYFLPVPIM